jgi:hypothetical protein
MLRVYKVKYILAAQESDIIAIARRYSLNKTDAASIGAMRQLTFSGVVDFTPSQFEGYLREAGIKMVSVSDTTTTTQQTGIAVSTFDALAGVDEEQMNEPHDLEFDIERANEILSNLHMALSMDFHTMYAPDIQAELEMSNPVLASYRAYVDSIIDAVIALGFGESEAIDHVYACFQELSNMGSLPPIPEGDSATPESMMRFMSVGQTTMLVKKCIDSAALKKNPS